ncbi:MAG: rhomboid family intramembrane serine protease [Actinomycetota bacterium]
MTEPVSQESSPTQTACYRHPDRVTGLACSQCGNLICGACAVQGTVGQFCPDCARQRGRQRMIKGRPTAAGLWRAAPVTTSIMVVAGLAFLAGRISTALEADLLRSFAQFNALVGEGQWYRIITPVLLHGSIAHIFFNMFALYQLGPAVEQRSGAGSYLGLYLSAAAWGGALAYRLGGLEDVLIGASGAVFGLFGLWLHSAFRLRDTAFGRNLLSSLWVSLLLNAALPFVLPGISWQGHLGGLVAGVITGELWSRVKRPQRPLVSLAMAVVAVLAVMS